MVIIANLIIVLFGLFIVFSGFLMFFKPEKVRGIIAKAGSTFFINYAELISRLLIGVCFIISSKEVFYELYFKVFGYFLIGSAIVLMCIPIKIHHDFAKNASEKLKPIYLKICAPFSILFGCIIIYVIC
ncbi:MAG: hypothetical protein ABNG98_02645 [Flavobacterium sp.]|jgi:hypothetical protein